MRKLTVLLMLLCMVSGISAKKASRPVIDRIDPPMWWTGMECDTLQLMVYGPGIANCDVTADYPGVKIAEAVKLDSPDYLFLYMTVADNTTPGIVKLKFSYGNKSTTIDYQLLGRDRSGDEYEGFDAGDVLYLIMPDRFADGDPSNNDLTGRMKNPSPVDRKRPNARHGGDIKGIRDHLGYIDSLGVTAIWVNPVQENDQRGGSYHGYATTDYYAIDPRFGSNEEWKAFVKEASDLGLKVVMDMIFNHCGSDHVWMTNPPSKDWFNFPDTANYVETNHRLSTVYDPYASQYDLDKATGGWFVRGMPDLNQKNPHLMKYLIQNSIWWIENSKINGIRMDTYPYADMRAMAGWIDAVQREYPKFNIVGECWYNNEGSEAFWQRGSKVNSTDPRLETVMDFVLMLNAPKAFGDQTDSWNGISKIYDHLALDYLFPNPQKILTFLDNHDTDRFLREMPENLGSWKQAQTFLLTSRGIPQIYYGTELLMNGTKAHGDGNIRLDVPGGFPGDSVSQFTAAGRSVLQNEAFDYLSKLLHWRRGAVNDVIARGSLKHFFPENGLYVYRRELDGRHVTVILNGRDSENRVNMKNYNEIMQPGTELTDALTGRKVTIEPEMTFAPREIMILQNF